MSNNSISRFKLGQKRVSPILGGSINPSNIVAPVKADLSKVVAKIKTPPLLTITPVKTQPTPPNNNTGNRNSIPVSAAAIKNKKVTNFILCGFCATLIIGVGVTLAIEYFNNKKK